MENPYKAPGEDTEWMDGYVHGRNRGIWEIRIYVLALLPIIADYLRAFLWKVSHGFAFESLLSYVVPVLSACVGAWLFRNR